MKKMTKKKDSDNKRKFEKETNIAFVFWALVCFALAMSTLKITSVVYMVFYALPLVFALAYIFLPQEVKDKELLGVWGLTIFLSYMILSSVLAGAIKDDYWRAPEYAIMFSFLTVANCIYMYYQISKMPKDKPEEQQGTDEESW